MHSSLREDSHLILVEGVVQVSCAILSGDRSKQTTLNNEVEFSGTGMNVRSIEATRAKESDCDSSALADESRECCVICSNNLSTITFSDASNSAGIREVEDEVAVCEESLTLDGIRSKD